VSFLCHADSSFKGLNFKDDPTVGSKIHAILTGPAGVLLAALVSTFGSNKRKLPTLSTLTDVSLS
jgi:hypothetical protein